MLGYRWLLGFSIVCNVLAVGMFVYQLAADRETEAIPFILLFAGLIGTFAGTALRGRFPRRALGMVLEWAAIHQQKLLDNWDRLHNDETPQRIDPLD
ncbi:MAG: DUF4160 domain-containing protein [Planctomycetota bacterium]